MKVADIANEIFLENGQPTDTSIPSIAFWVRTNVGKLNNLVYESFYVDDTTKEILKTNCSTPQEISVLPVAIIKTMYKVYRIDLDIRAVLLGAQTNTVIEAADQDFSVKRINKSELLKTLTTLKKIALEEQKELVHTYRSYNGAPSQVTGDDTQVGFYESLSNQYLRNVTVGGGQ